MSRYVLGLRRAEAQTDDAMPCKTARAAVQAIEAWVREQGNVTVILRSGKPITEYTLRRDVARQERDSRAVRKEPIPS